jgi:hypothetical protein
MRLQMIDVRVAITTLIVVSGAALVSCGARFDARDVEGRWVLTPDSRRLFKDGLAGVNPFIEFDSAGAFNAIDIPAELIGSPPDLSIAGGRGRWSLATERLDPELLLRFESVNGLPREYGLTLSIRGLADDPVLTYFRGDPDSAVMIEFEKQPRN